MTTPSFKNGDLVRFKPGPKARADVTAKVTGTDRHFLITTDAGGKERRVRAGLCRAA